MNLISAKNKSLPALRRCKNHYASLVRFDTMAQCDRTDGHLCYSNTSACIACYATALVRHSESENLLLKVIFHAEITSGSVELPSLVNNVLNYGRTNTI